MNHIEIDARSRIRKLTWCRNGSKTSLAFATAITHAVLIQLPPSSQDSKRWIHDLSTYNHLKPRYVVEPNACPSPTQLILKAWSNKYLCVDNNHIQIANLAGKRIKGKSWEQEKQTIKSSETSHTSEKNWDTPEVIGAVMDVFNPAGIYNLFTTYNRTLNISNNKPKFCHSTVILCPSIQSHICILNHI